jgi:hypothetical protein
MTKLKRLIEQLHFEKEKRVELAELPAECSGMKPLKIRQGFIQEIKDGDDAICDVRVRETNGRVYTMTGKYRPKKHEATTKISQEMFDSLWKKTWSKQKKERYILESGWVVDKFNDGKIVAEFEYGKDKKVGRMPNGFKSKQNAEHRWQTLP